MSISQARLLPRLRAVLSLLTFSTLAALSPAPAQAHYMLLQPASTYMQGQPYGDPQKTAPCGPAAGGGTATGQVTTYRPGDTVTLTIRETIFHPGHYRVSVGPDPSKFMTPPVTPMPGDQCASVPIDNNPVLPVVADGLLPHATAFAGDQTVTFKLPAGFTCQNCTMQIVQYMSKHAAPCFYYHCATVNIVDNADMSMQPVLDLSAPPDMADQPTLPPMATGCACQLGAAGASAPASRGGALVISLLALSALALRRFRLSLRS
jgi:hypothetical protein